MVFTDDLSSWGWLYLNEGEAINSGYSAFMEGTPVDVPAADAATQEPGTLLIGPIGVSEARGIIMSSRFVNPSFERIHPELTDSDIIYGSENDIKLAIGYELSDQVGGNSLIRRLFVSQKALQVGAIVGVLALGIGSIWIIVLAFGTSLKWGLGSIFWPIAIVYAAMHFKTCKIPVILMIVGVTIAGGLMIAGTATIDALR